MVILIHHDVTSPHITWLNILAETQEDEACQKLIEDLLSYAIYAVAKNEADIRDTLRNRIKAGARAGVGRCALFRILKG